MKANLGRLPRASHCPGYFGIQLLWHSYCLGDLNACEEACSCAIMACARCEREDAT